MKKINVRVVTCVFMLLLTFSGMAQNTANAVKSIVEPLRLAVSRNKTTNLIFPYSIVSIDRGHRDLLAQLAKGVDNILQIKAASDTLPETNLSVVVADGSFYSFVARYAKEPSVLNINLGFNGATVNMLGILPANKDNHVLVKNTAEAISTRKPLLNGPSDKNDNILMKLRGLYIKDDMFYWQIELDNASNVKYDVEQFRFFIRDQKRIKRTASQELELSPAYISGEAKCIAAKSRQTVVFAFPKFTIPDNKFLIVQLMEHNGGRHVDFKVPNKILLKAKNY